jgi:hypothetical protein
MMEMAATLLLMAIEKGANPQLTLENFKASLHGDGEVNGDTLQVCEECGQSRKTCF